MRDLCEIFAEIQLGRALAEAAEVTSGVASVIGNAASSRGCSRESLKEMLVCLVISDGDRHSARVG